MEIAQPRTVDTSPMASIIWRLALATGILVRIAVVAIPGNHLYSPWSGGGDAPSYVLLAQNLASGRGFTYASMPSAFRPPLLPLLIAGLMLALGKFWLVGFRLFEFALGLATVVLVYRLSLKFFGKRAARCALLIGLFFPTLIYTTSEVLSECLAAFFVSAFLFYLVSYFQNPGRKTAMGMGVTTSLAALARFNLAALIIPAAWSVLARRDRPGWFGRLVLLGASSLLVISPWMIRNGFVFGDPLLLGTTGGYAALQGVLDPSGRAQDNEVEQRRVSGWLNYDLETNLPARRSLPGEVELNHRDWRITLGLWKTLGWRMAPILWKKLGYFWLSTDQLFETTHFSGRTRFLREAGALAYCVALGLAIFGWRLLRQSPNGRPLAWLLVVYAISLTAVNLPFAMETRHRLPMMDPLIASLAGGGCVWGAAKIAGRFGKKAVQDRW